ncbi:hypothetical protein ACTXT7_004887 [Hymenolepis weldensis]
MEISPEDKSNVLPASEETESEESEEIEEVCATTRDTRERSTLSAYSEISLLVQINRPPANDKDTN